MCGKTRTRFFYCQTNIIYLYNSQNGCKFATILPQREACEQQFWPSDMMMYLDTPGVVPDTSRKALIHHLFPHGVHQWISLGRLSVDLSVDQATCEVYVGISAGFIRTDAMCLDCVAGSTLHKPPQGNIRFRCPTLEASQSWAHYATTWRIRSPGEKGKAIVCGSG